MAGLSWIAVLLTFSLSVGNYLAAVDQNYLTRSVQKIMKEYRIPGQFSVAVNIPKDQKKLGDVFNNDKPDTVKEGYEKGDDVYTGTNVVAATYKKENKSGKIFTEHAEARVLDNIQGLAQRRAGHSLILYSYLSPCGTKCTNESNYFNILNQIRNNVINRWTDYAFVFTKVFDQIAAGKRIPPKETKQALTNLASAIGQNNIFRCYKPPGVKFKCVMCYNNNGKVKDKCIKNE